MNILKCRSELFLIPLAAATVLTALTACGGDTALDELNELEVDPAATIAADQLVTETTVTETFILTASTVTEMTYETGEPGVDYKPEFAGRWELTEWNNETKEDGQYGSEQYRIMYQMELRANGSCVLYDRCQGISSLGTWDGLNEHVALINFPNYNRNPIFSTLNLEKNDGKLIQPNMAMTFSQVNSFTQPAHPSVYAVAGEWICDTVVDFEGNSFTDSYNDIPLESFNTSVYSIEDVASIVCQGAQFFAHDDGTGRLNVEYEAIGDTEHGWNGSSMWMNGNVLVWEVKEEAGISQLHFRRSES